MNNLTAVTIFLVLARQTSQSSPAEQYHAYAGNTHSHTVYTWSHGDQYVNPPKKEPAAEEPGIYVSAEGVQYPTNRPLKPDWKKHQGPPSEHYALAKTSDYDFYVTSDHSQDAAFHPTSPTNTAWVATGLAAQEATGNHFVALRGFEHSENNGPNGVGHINVINSAEYLNALAPGVDLPYLYKWLKTAQPNGDGPVVASFNHPGARQYNNWDYRDAQVTDIITMIEVINSNRATHYPAFVNALDKGWKVSPVAGIDNHGFWGISHAASRTFVLATNLTKVAILDGMKHRRTYAALEKTIQCSYTVNGAIMGSTLDHPKVFEFAIAISDSETSDPKHKIAKVDIVKDGGTVVREYRPTPAYSVQWNPTINDPTNKFFFVRVWNAGGGDGTGAKAANPVAWLAPVWTGR